MKRRIMMRVAVLVACGFYVMLLCGFQSKEKGYDLPVDEKEKEAAEADCTKVMRMVEEIYKAADKGDALNAVLGEETLNQMLGILQESGYPVTVRIFNSNMANYEKLEGFLKDSLNGRMGEIVTYEIQVNGGVCRRLFRFDGRDLYVLSTNAVWNEENKPVITATSYKRIKKWEYTKKGYFSFEYCVPEPPDVSEAVNGNVLLRVKPQQEENLEIAETYLYPIGYQGNNLFCSNWDAEHLEELDYNGLFEYLYFIKFGERIDSEKYANGIPEKEFEDLMMTYLPVTAAELRQYAVYEKDSKTYAWVRLGCFNYAPNAFGTSYPEITDIQENEDGTVTLTVDAVCEMAGSDEVMSHRLTVLFPEEGGIMYLENKILDHGLEQIPVYKYRFGNR